MCLFVILHTTISEWIIVEDQNVGCIFSCISGVILFGGSPKPSMRNFSQARNIKYWHLGILFGGVPQTLNEFKIHQAYFIYHMGILFGGSPQTLNEITHQVYIIWREYRGILSGSFPQTLDEELLTSSQHQVSTFGDFIRGCSPNPQWILNSSSLHYLPYMGILFGGTPQTLNELIDLPKLHVIINCSQQKVSENKLA